MMELNVKGKRLLVKRDSEEEKTKSGILIPQSARQKKFFATVVNVGALVTDYKVGDYILFEMFGGDEITLNDQEYVILTEEMVVGTVTGTPEPAALEADAMSIEEARSKILLVEAAV